MNWKDVKRELLRDARVSKEYEALEAEHELARSILERRLAKGMSQRQLAAKARTRQPVISRLESGTVKPSIRLLERVAEALDADLVVRLKPHKGQAQNARRRSAR